MRHLLATVIVVLALVALVPQQAKATGPVGLGNDYTHSARVNKPIKYRIGYAAHYRVGLIERVARNRGMVWTPCMIASSYYPIGKWVSVRSHVTGRTMSCKVVDVTAPKHIALVRSRGIVIEFGAANIGAMCNLRYVGQEPPNKCPVTVYG